MSRVSILIPAVIWVVAAGLLLTGCSRDYGDRRSPCVRAEAQGILDPWFGKGGVAVHNVSLGDYGLAIALDASGRILVAGERWNSTVSPPGPWAADMATWRYR